MKRVKAWRALWIGLPVALGVFLIIACDQEWTGETTTDVHVDTVTPDVPDDSPVPDVPEDTAPEVEPDTGPDCVYPEGPYGFNAVGDTVGPASWPSSIKGSEEVSELAQADFEAFYCDPDVQSIVVFVATTS